TPINGNAVLDFSAFGAGDFTIFESTDYAAMHGGKVLTSLDLTNPGAALDHIGDLLPTWTPDWLKGALDTVAPALKTAVSGLEGLQAPKPTFSMPILDDPSQLFGMLLGKHAVLVELNMAPFDLKANFSAFFSILGPLGVSINADFAMHVHFDFGYDTLGVEEFAKGGFKDPLLLFDGFFINDVNPDGTPQDHLTFHPRLSSPPPLNLSP